MIHRDLITARTETRARLDAFLPPCDYRNDAIILHTILGACETFVESSINTITKFAFEDIFDNVWAI